MAEFELLASAAFGMEAIVVRELADLGYADARVDDGRVRFRGDLAAICRANLWLRCAERVQVVVAEFPARNFDDLFDQIKVLPWEEWLPVDAKFPVTARCVRSDIRSVPNTQKMVKRAIVERLRKVYSRHWYAETGVQYDIEAIILGDRALMTIDTTGEGLHKRGYRNLVGRAPLRETVAAAMVKLSYWNRGRLLVDPFCGSGTIPIEAAMIGRNLAPGRNRAFSAEQWEQIPRSTWAAARQEVKDLEERQPLPIPIIATDNDRSAIRMATQHARQAGVQTDIHFEEKDFVAFPTNRDAGILICNPPYGERLGEENEVRQLYRDMGELLRPLDDWSLYILTGAEGFEREFGKQADRRRKLYNARIACTFYQYLGPKPAGAAAGIEQPEVETEQVRRPVADQIDADQDSLEKPAVWEHPRTDDSESKRDFAGRERVPVRFESGSPRQEQDVAPPTSRPALPAGNPWANARRPQSAPAPVQENQIEAEAATPPIPSQQEELNATVDAPVQSTPVAWGKPATAEPVRDDLSTVESAVPSDGVPAVSDETQTPVEEVFQVDLPVGELTAHESPVSEQAEPEGEVPAPSSSEPNALEQQIVSPPADAETASVPEPVSPQETPAEEPTADSPAAADPVEREETSGKSHPWKKNPWQRR